MIPPTPGRIVYYREGPATWPAMITEVHNDRLVTLKVFTADNIYSKGGVQLLQDKDKPEGRDYCEWMDYQKGQAAKSDDLLTKLLARIEDVEKRLSAYGKPDPLAPISKEKK